LSKIYSYDFAHWEWFCIPYQSKKSRSKFSVLTGKDIRSDIWVFNFFFSQIYYKIGATNSRRRRRDNHEDSAEVTGEVAVLSADELNSQTPYSYQVAAANDFMVGPRSSPQDFQTRAAGANAYKNEIIYIFF